MQTPNWEELARSLDLITDRSDGGRMELSGSDYAREALALILGPDAIREAVDHYVTNGPGSELARSVLWLLHPESAMDRCFEIFRSGLDLELRRSAVELLQVVADRRVLPWIDLFLEDPDEKIQFWGLGIVDQLAFSELIEAEEARPILDQVSSHPNRHVREKAVAVREYLAAREDAV